MSAEVISRRNDDKDTSSELTSDILVGHVRQLRSANIPPPSTHDHERSMQTTYVRPVVLLIPARNALSSAASIPRWTRVPNIACTVVEDEVVPKLLCTLDLKQ